MVESSKILTVSYGTFSCTLEGFDDSFSTMKAIAEYFRDLAQGDRYFGAEPPAPDAEMLTRIAEKEIARRVEARADESGIVLRAVEADKAPAMPPVATPPSVEEVAEVAAPIVEEDTSESTHTATADVDGDVAGPEAGEDTSPTLVASSSAAPEVDEDVVEEMDVTAPAASFADMDVNHIAAVPAHPDADSVAAKLQRIRAVVSTGATAAATTSAVDDHAEDMVADDTTHAAEAQEADTDFAMTTSDDDLGSDTEDENDFAAEVETDDVAAIEDNATQAADEIEAISDDAEDVIVADTVTAEVAETDVDDSVAEDVDEGEVAQVEDAPKQNFRARILRVAKKPVVTEAIVAEPADATAAIQESVAAQMGDDVIAENIAFDDIALEEAAELADFDDAPEGTLSDEDEAELMADLAEAEREVEAKVEVEAKAEVEVEEPKSVVPTGRDILPEADDAAMSRIMHEADEQLSEPEGSRRRSAIAQLKAAVAATEAARQLGDKGDDAAAQENAFRDDLNEAVRPRSAGDLPRTQERTERPRPAPLKLVAAQRVGEEEAEEQAAAPRRVATDTSQADAASFTDFAANMGATELPDLLEAAAAYTAYVEGIEDFSRPQIMKKVQASATEEFSREDGLRSFGTLLRQGRISKVRNGRFQVSDQTRFKPEKKAG